MLKIAFYISVCISFLGALNAGVSEQESDFFQSVPEANYLVAYDIPVNIPNSINNLVSFFDTVRFDKKNILSAEEDEIVNDLFQDTEKKSLAKDQVKTIISYFKEVPSQVKYEVPLYSEAQVELIEEFAEKKNTGSPDDRFYDATELLKPLLIQGFPFWCIFDVQESQLFIYSSSILHACFLNYITYEVEYAPVVQSLEFVIYSVAHTGRSIEESVTKEVGKVHHVTARTFTRPGEEATIKVANETVAFEAEVITTMSDYIPLTAAIQMDTSFQSDLFSCTYSQSFTSEKATPYTLKMGLSKDKSRCYVMRVTADYTQSNSFKLSAKHKVDLPLDKKPSPQEMRTLSLSLSDLTARESASFSAMLEMCEVGPQGDYNLTKLYDTRFNGLESVTYSEKSECLIITATPSTTHFISSFKDGIEASPLSTMCFSLYKIKENTVEGRDLLTVLNDHQPIYSYNHGEGHNIRGELNDSNRTIVYSSEFNVGEGEDKLFFRHMFDLSCTHSSVDIWLKNFCAGVHENDPPRWIASIDGYSYIAMIKVKRDASE